MNLFNLLIEQGGIYGIILAIAIAFISAFTVYRITKSISTLKVARADLTHPDHTPRWLCTQRLVMTLDQTGPAGMERTLQAESRKLHGGLGLLAAVAAAAPLLGLLGTVQGMTRSFFALGEAGGLVNINTLADGIRLALFTTLSGLIVAIVGVLCHALLGALVQAEENALHTQALLLLKGGANASH